MWLDECQLALSRTAQKRICKALGIGRTEVRPKLETVSIDQEGLIPQEHDVEVVEVTDDYARLVHSLYRLMQIFHNLNQHVAGHSTSKVMLSKPGDYISSF